MLGWHWMNGCMCLTFFANKRIARKLSKKINEKPKQALSKLNTTLNLQVSRLTQTHQWTKLSAPVAKLLNIMPFIMEQMETHEKIQLNLTKKKLTNHQTVTKISHQALVN